MKKQQGKETILKIDLKQGKGITLIALVITIIILIILATVTLNVVLGEGGLIDRIQQAKYLTEQAALEEQESLNTLMDEYANMMAEDNIIPEPPRIPETVEEAKNEGIRFEDTTKLEDDNGNEVWIPGGFEIDEESAIDADDGIVITDGINEFVWIPVPDYTTMYQEAPGTKLTGVETTTDVYSKFKIREGENYISGMPGDSDYMTLKEPDVLEEYDTEEQYYSILEYNNIEEMAKGIVTEYTETYNSIKKYKGFYIGRYELTGTVENPTVKRGQAILTENWYYLKKACSNIVTTEYAQSTMIYGNQWDRVLEWIIETGDKTDYQVNEDSTDWGNSKNSTGAAAIDSGIEQTAGKNEAWKANNIYDLAGNHYEFTQTAFTGLNTRIYVNGCWHSTGTYDHASKRHTSYLSTGEYSNTSSRPALYIKVK
mgnify:CR=1 FL=1|jgi:type II secretory pathway pseudopilin PulG